MAERRKGRKKKEPELKEEDPKPTKEEYAAAKYLRQKLPEKKTTLLGHKVDYFIASKAIDCLLDSPWATNKGKSDVLFTTRESVVEFMDRMLQHKFFHRARKIIVQKDVKKKKKDEETKKKDKDSEVSKKRDDETKKKDKDSEVGKKKDDETKKKDKDSEVSKKKDDETKKKDKDSEVSKKKERETEDEKKKETKDKKEEKKENELAVEPKKEKEQKKTKTKAENDGKVEEKDGDSGERKREKKKIKLDMHMDQIFVDGSEPYVWIYDPIPMRTWINGTLMVVAAVLVCLFPLWPKTIRHYIYYLSIVAAGFLVFIIGLAVVRLTVFVVIWVVTLGKHHLWLLPNLTEDVGFFESFWPLYNYEYKGTKNKDTKAKKKESKDKESQNKEPGKSDSSTDQEVKVDGQVHSESEQDESEGDKNKADNGENGFEMVEVEDLGPVTKEGCD